MRRLGMARFKKIPLFISFLSVFFFTAGCMDRQTPAEEMFGKLEKVVEIEKTFQEQQEPLVNLENEEKELYKKIIELNVQKNHDEIIDLADRAIAVAQERQEHIDVERQSILESKQEFNTVTEIIEKIDEPGLKEQAIALYDLMQERYEIHEKLYDSYARGLSSDIELYTMLKASDRESEKLENQISMVNKAYEEVLKYNGEFNEKTEQYNKAKLQFYQAAGLDVQVGSNE
jgi:hypothetical protein